MKQGHWNYRLTLTKWLLVVGLQATVLILTTCDRAQVKIAFLSDRDGNYEIYVMDVDGSNPTNLTNNPAEDVSPAWSPDGSKIAFLSDRDANYEIYVMDANGSNPTMLTNNLSGIFPAWSPDGSKIAFLSDRGGNGEIYVMDTDGSNPTNLTNNPAADSFPAWSP
jgi:TolB protein